MRVLLSRPHQAAPSFAAREALGRSRRPSPADAVCAPTTPVPPCAPPTVDADPRRFVRVAPRYTVFPALSSQRSLTSDPGPGARMKTDDPLPQRSGAR